MIRSAIVSEKVEDGMSDAKTLTGFLKAMADPLVAERLATQLVEIEAREKALAADAEHLKRRAADMDKATYAIKVREKDMADMLQAHTGAVENVRLRLGEVAAEKAALATEREKALAWIDQIMAELNAREAAADAAENDAFRKAAKADALIAEYETKLAKLKAAMGV